MTTDARDHVLAEVRRALGGARLPDAAVSHPGSFGGSPEVPAPGDRALIARFGAELEALHGTLHRASSAADAARVAGALVERHGARRVLAWSERWLGCPGLLAVLQQAGVEVTAVNLGADRASRRARLEDIEPIIVGLTGAEAGLADTGSLVLVSGPGRSRLASLLPPVHIALLPEARVYPTLPAFLAARPGVLAEGSSLVLVTGPSRTADIEMTLTHGVHGPREVHVIVVPQPTSANPMT